MPREQGVGDPHHVEGPQAAQRDEPDHRVQVQLMQGRGVQGRVGVVFAHQADDPERRQRIVLILDFRDIQALSMEPIMVDAVSP